MDTTSLMSQFADPNTIKSLTIAQQFIGGLITAVLGMGITFICLGILQFVIGLFDKLNSPVALQLPTVSPSETIPAAPLQQEEEIIAAITAALAIALQTGPDRILIRNIKKIPETAPAWHRAGQVEHLLGNG